MTTNSTINPFFLDYSYDSQWQYTGESPSNDNNDSVLVTSLNIMNETNNLDYCNLSPMSNHTYSSTSMSPMSSTSEASSYNYQNLNTTYYDASQTHDGQSSAYLSIIEQPVEKFRFRYESEMHGTHGSLLGRSSSTGKKTFPSVQLHNFNGPAWIRCSLSQLPTSLESPKPHSHSLVIREGNKDKKDPHEVLISQEQGYQAAFQGMGIIHTPKKIIKDELYRKFMTHNCYQNMDETKLRNFIKNESSAMNLNQVCLCFEAYERCGDNFEAICQPVYSLPINNMKSALTGELKINRLSAISGDPAGNEEVFMFVEKVGKKNIKVRFYETDALEPHICAWEGWGKFNEADVHHQYGIVFRTPKYGDGTLEKSKKVYIQLVRPSDNTFSEPLEFMYKPSSQSGCSNRKRARNDSESSFIDVPTVVLNNEIFEGNSDKDFDVFNISLDEIDSFLEQYSFGNVEKDSVAEVAEVDQLKQIDSFLLLTLKRIVVILKMSLKQGKLTKGRQYVESVYRDVRFQGESVLDWAIKSNVMKYLHQHLEIIRKCGLQKALQFRNNDNKACLHVACSNGKLEQTRLLLKFGADPNFVDGHGNTPLHCAVQEQSIDCVAMLLGSHSLNDSKPVISLDQCNDDGFTPFHLAVSSNNLAICKLLEENASISNTDLHNRNELKKGNSILHIAVESQSIDILRYLLKIGKVDVNVRNASGHTALYLAKVNDYQYSNAMVELLKAFNAIDEHESAEDAARDSSGDITNLIETQPSTKPTKLVDEKLENSLSNPFSDMQLARKGASFNTDNLNTFCQIFNEDGKWKMLASKLGMSEILINEWQKKSDPAKMLFKFAEATRVPPTKFLQIFTEMNETAAVSIIHMTNSSG